MRRAFLDRPRYRAWFFSFCLWSFNVHRRCYSLADTFIWEKDIARLLSDAETLYPTRWSTGATHYLVHIPMGLRTRGPLLCWGMYGLERFGDYLMKMSLSRHPNKHCSIVYAYLLHELRSFLAVHDPSKYRPNESFAQGHMFSISQVSCPSSWEVSGHRSRDVNLTLDDVAAVTALYRADASALDFDLSILHFAVEHSALQIVGKLWCGVRYFEMYYEGLDQFVLGQGHCCIGWASMDEHSFDGRRYGIIRNVVSHQAVMRVDCPTVYFFNVELLSISPASSDVPLSGADATGDRVWISQAELDYLHAGHQFCLRDHDDPEAAQFYLIELN
jgi:hypothetical protein